MLIMLSMLSIDLVKVTGMATEDEIRPGYGIKFNHIGKLVQGFNRYDLIAGIELPYKW